MSDLIYKQSAINATWFDPVYKDPLNVLTEVRDRLKSLPVVQPEIIQCNNCKYWRRQTAYNGAPLSFGFCECDYMWQSLYGETTEVAHIDTDDDFYCGYAERRTDADTEV